MKRIHMKKCFILGLSAISVFTVAACGGKNDSTKTETTTTNSESENLTNKTKPLVFSTAELDGVFNPFFSTSGADASVVSMTQLPMLTNDSKGNPVYGDNQATVTKDLEIVTQGTANVDQTTTYYFVLKNNVKFSNGSALTMKDVLFNLYVYLDPVYTGSSTIYSTDIVGLQEYRTQEDRETEQDSFKAKFEDSARQRILDITDACYEIISVDHKTENVTEEDFMTYLKDYADVMDKDNLVQDVKKALELFDAELESDYSNNMDSYEDITFEDEAGNVHKNLLTTDVEAFLYAEGFIRWNKKDAELTSSLVSDPAELKTWTKAHAIETVRSVNVPNAIDEIVMYWATASDLFEYITNQEMENYYASVDRKYTNISGIKFANRDKAVTVNGVKYEAPQYNGDGSVKNDTCEVLAITIHDVDPKAIWNFSFAVAPMYYYSDEAHIAAFDYESNFGVEYSSQSFMSDVVNSSDKIGVPVGAGAYCASKASGGTEGVKTGDFYSLGIIYFESNPYFVLGEPNIKKIRYKVVSNNQMLSALYAEEIHFAEPNAKPETITELNDKKSSGIGNTSIQTSGYGYIGINAGKIAEMKVRQAIMFSINTQECVDYYKTTATAIYRPMSKSSWAYPTDSTSYYPYIGGKIPADLSKVCPEYKAYVEQLGKKAGQTFTQQEQVAFIQSLVEDAGYELNGSIYVKGDKTLKFTFTIAGSETDHPAYQALLHASEILNKSGFQITVSTDANALKKLATGDLTVWAAAWGSTIDPDLYQVYHKDSSATSTLNWGYKQIKANVGGKYDDEVALLEELSDLIEEGRKTNDTKVRAQIYSQALDIIMQLAIELPTYQRDDLFAYNTNVIDASSFNTDLSSFKGLTSEIWNVSLNRES